MTEVIQSGGYSNFEFPDATHRQHGLALGKDFAVSLPSFDGHVPFGTLCLSAPASLLAPLGLPPTAVSRYLSMPYKNEA
jgi:hypothetical protein